VRNFLRRFAGLSCAVASVVAGAAAGAARAHAQGAATSAGDTSALRVQAAWNEAVAQPFRPLLSFALSRPLQPTDGRLAVIVDRSDLSALLSVRGTTASLSLRGESLPDGMIEVMVYLVASDGTWHERGRFALRRRTRTGFDSTGWQPRLDAQSEGQLDQSAGSAFGSPRATPFQDVAWNGGLGGVVRRGATRAEWQSLLVANARQPLRLRAGQLGATAPVVDLASYNVQLSHRSLALAAGHVTVGNDRLVASQFRSRGLSARAGLGRRGEVTLASVAGSELVGWDDPVGLARPSHRVQLASVALEALPQRPGVLRAELTAVDGSLQPLPSFSQQSVTDREQSRGFGGSLSASLPSQRARLALGVAQSRFTNPNDRLLSGDSPIVPVQAETRWARFADLSVDALRQRKLAGVSTSLQFAARHQHTDPLYRSVAAFTQADQRQDVLEATGALGVIQLQGSAGNGRDNLAEVATLLTTRSRTRTANVTIPVAALFARPTTWWLPSLTMSWQGSGQRGDTPPDSAGFRSTAQRPDQWSTNGTLSAGWQHSRVQLALRVNRSFVDNRQAGRETSDFRTLVHAITLGVTPVSTLSLNVDLSDERADALEQRTRARSQRLAFQGDWRPFRTTSLSGAWSAMLTDDRAATRRGRNDEFRAELSQGIQLRRGMGEPDLRAFVRFAQSRAFTRFGGLLERTAPQRSLAAGVSARIL
jgi:hypothetical protein